MISTTINSMFPPPTSQKALPTLLRHKSATLLAILVYIFLFLGFSHHVLSSSPQLESLNSGGSVSESSTTMMLMQQLSSSNSSSSIASLQALPGVSLMNYNVTEFSILLGNITFNLTWAQNEIVMTNGYVVLSIATYAVRLFALVILDTFVIAGLLLLRNYEPIKSKFVVSMTLIIINVVGQVQGLIDYLPMSRIYFERYWNQFIMEKKSSSIDAATFYQNNLGSNGLPTWMENYMTFENVYCFINEYILFGLVFCSVALYSIQVIKLVLLTVLKDKRQQIVKSLEDFKQKQLEKLRAIRLQNKDQQQQQQQNNNNRKSLRKTIGESTDSLGGGQQQLQLNDGGTVPTSSPASSSTNNLGETTANTTTGGSVGGPFHLDLSVLSQSTTANNTSFIDVNSQRPPSARGSRPSEFDDNTLSMIDYDDIALDLTTDDDAMSTSYEEISKQGKFVNLLKKLIKYRVVETCYIVFWLVVWFILVSIRIASHQPDTWSTLFYSWDQYSGYCRKADRDLLSYYALYILFILCAAIPVFILVDFVLSIISYIKVRKINKEKGEKTENFFIYYIYETDPFVYRIESISIIFWDLLALIVIAIIPSSDAASNRLALSMALAIGLNILGGCISNPGITLGKGIWNYLLAFKAKRKAANHHRSESNNDNNKNGDSSNTIQTIQQLISSPLSSFSIDFVISHKKERDLFYQYLREEYSVENLLFIEDVIKLRKMNEKHVRSKIMKIKEMTKLYLSESSSVFEINVPSKVIQSELQEYKQLINLINESKLKINQLPRVMKDVSMRYFPNIDLAKEELMKPLISNLCKPNIFALLNTEVYKNLMDSFYRFNNSRKWKEYIKSVQQLP